MRAINQSGLDLIKRHEGLRTRAYRDTGGVWTIGYGHTRTARPGMAISQEEAENLLRSDVRDAEQCVESSVRVPLSENEFAALVSFVFNVGCGAFKRSTLLRKLNAGDRAGASAEFKRWNKDNGRELLGLTRRRYSEMTLFVREP